MRFEVKSISLGVLTIITVWRVGMIHLPDVEMAAGGCGIAWTPVSGCAVWAAGAKFGSFRGLAIKVE
jgi:hypothetical protein